MPNGKSPNIGERVSKLETKVEGHALDLIGLHQAKHRHAGFITTLLNKVGVNEIQLKVHDRVIWTALFGVISLLVAVAGVFIVKYVLK